MIIAKRLIPCIILMLILEGLFGSFFFCLLVNYVGILLLVTTLTREAGFAQPDASNALFWWNNGGVIGAVAGALIIQALTHNQHHRAQNASRMRQLGVTPPMTDYILWFAAGRP